MRGRGGGRDGIRRVFFSEGGSPPLSIRPRWNSPMATASFASCPRVSQIAVSSALRAVATLFWCVFLFALPFHIMGWYVREKPCRPRIRGIASRQDSTRSRSSSNSDWAGRLCIRSVTRSKPRPAAVCWSQSTLTYGSLSSGAAIVTAEVSTPLVKHASPSLVAPGSIVNNKGGGVFMREAPCRLRTLPG